MCNTIQQWKKLKKLEIKRNPLEKNKKYECEIIASAFDLGTQKILHENCVNIFLIENIKKCI